MEAGPDRGPRRVDVAHPAGADDPARVRLGVVEDVEDRLGARGDVDVDGGEVRGGVGRCRGVGHASGTGGGSSIVISHTLAAERIARRRTTATPAPTAIAHVSASGSGARSVPAP